MIVLAAMISCKVDKEDDAKNVNITINTEDFTIMGKVVCAKCKSGDLMDISAWGEDGTSPIAINSDNGGNLIQRFYENGEFKLADIELVPGSKIRLMVMTEAMYKAEKEIDIPDDGHTIEVTFTLP